MWLKFLLSASIQEVQQKYFIKYLGITSIFILKKVIFRGSWVTWHAYIKIRTVFNTLMKTRARDRRPEAHAEAPPCTCVWLGVSPSLPSAPACSWCFCPLFCLQELKSISVRLRSGNWLSHWRKSHFEKLWVYICGMFVFIIHYSDSHLSSCSFWLSPLVCTLLKIVCTFLIVDVEDESRRHAEVPCLVWMFWRGFSSVIVHLSCPLSSFRPFGAAELISGCVLFKNVPNIDMVPSDVFISLIGWLWFSVQYLASIT